MIDHAEIRHRVAALRLLLTKEELDGFIIPRSDMHQGEEVPDSEERLAYISGFTGSAGEAIVTKDTAALFVDGRYTLQADQQTPVDTFDHQSLVDNPLTVWLKSNVKKGQKIGFDPWLHTKSQVDAFRKVCRSRQAELMAVDQNLVDLVWDDRPASVSTPIFVHPLEYAGEPSEAKISSVAQKVKENDADLAVISLPDSIAWLLNIRASDLRSTAVPLSFVIISRGGDLTWFIDGERLSDEVRDHLPDTVSVLGPDQLQSTLVELGGRWQLDASSAPSQLFRLANDNSCDVVVAPDPVIAMKATKNRVELEGMRAAHIRDGAAVCRFVEWLSEEGTDRATSNNPITELEAIEKFLGLRREVEGFHSTSFDTICGSGDNGAIVHYRANEASNRAVQDGELVLVDSGGQYLDGTTDITRVIAIGDPSKAMKRHYTLVLKGHLALHAAVFPKGTSGQEIDCLARQYLWQEGLDYDHGTGHGVGAFLNVHEGPARIAKARGALVPLEPGMVLSNEPGFYKAGEYGIRIENLEIVVPRSDLNQDGRELYGFETLTFAPYEPKLIDTELLTTAETEAINLYHREVWEKVSPSLDETTKTWLAEQTKPLN